MNLNTLLSDKITKELVAQVSYFSDTFYSLTESLLTETQYSKPICIVSRKHYREFKKSYPAVSLKELKDILTLQKNASSDLINYQIIPNKAEEGYFVVVTQFLTEQYPQLKNAWLLLPESQLMGMAYINHVLDVNTPAGTLFVSHIELVNSVYQAGLIKDLHTYIHSIGLSETRKNLHIEQSQFPSFLMQCLLSLDFIKLKEIALIHLAKKPNVRQLHALYLAPLLSVTLYLGLTVAWQLTSIELTTSMVKEEQSKANAILKQKQKLDEINLLTKEFNLQIANNSPVHPHWQFINLALKHNTLINYFRMDNGQIELDGQAPNANELLTDLNQNSLVKQAVFNGSVRKSNGVDNFNILITLVKVGGSNE